MVSTKTTKKKVSSSKPSSSTSSCKYKKVGETKDSAHKCVYVKTGTGTGSGSDKTFKYYTASIVDKKKKYKVYHGELKRVQKGKGWGKQLANIAATLHRSMTKPTGSNTQIIKNRSDFNENSHAHGPRQMFSKNDI